MSDSQNIVLIGEPDDERFHWLEELLYEKFGKQSKQVKTLEDVIEEQEKSPSSLIFISDELPLDSKSGKKDPSLNFTILQYNTAFSWAIFVCIVTKDHRPNLTAFDKHLYYIYFRNFPPTDKEQEDIISDLGKLGNQLPPLIDDAEIEKITKWNKDNRILRRQIRSLSETQDIDGGENHLYRLISKCVDYRNIRHIEIKHLGQGKSGASVFRLIVSYKNGKKPEFILKVDKLLWKLENEVKGHIEASEPLKEKYTIHIPKINTAFRPIFYHKSGHEYAFIVNSPPFISGNLPWYAICYDFLGGEDFGKFIDLETELIASPSVLTDITNNSDSQFLLDSDDWEKVTEHRLKVLEAILDGLCDLWYAKKDFADRREEFVWNLESADAQVSDPLPPYQLTERVKGWVQDFLDSREASIGNRLFPEWDKYIDSVLKIVGDEKISDLGLLSKKILFTLSPVHGDLNANNVLLWLKYNRYPFLIDLPFYQEKGHVLQDFVRLETEIKFALMDRQEESPESHLLAFDNTVSQIPLWIEMENQLLDETSLNEPKLSQLYSEKCEWKEEGFHNNISLCYKLILLIRKKAFEVQQKEIPDRPAPASFADEYLPALLYHTIRSIGYPSLSVFKRLLAVYSSGSIINKLLEK